MQVKIIIQARSAVLQVLRERYLRASRSEKSKVLDEFVTLGQCHRKLAIQGCLLHRRFMMKPFPKNSSSSWRPATLDQLLAIGLAFFSDCLVFAETGCQAASNRILAVAATACLS